MQEIALMDLLDKVFSWLELNVSTEIPLPRGFVILFIFILILLFGMEGGFK